MILAASLTLATMAQEKGFQPERRVKEASRMDWEFAAEPKATVSVNYDARRQRYQLFVPGDYAASQAWPLVVFVGPGDDPLGWRTWKVACEDGACLFAAPYGAGNGCPQAQRLRLILDVLDDVRREFRIDPEQTYLVGVEDGAEPAARLATAFPEYVAGLVAVGGDVSLPRLPHLRQRMRERQSVALVAGKGDAARFRLEKYHAPLLADLGVRSRFWTTADSTPKDVLEWLREDLNRRRKDAAEDGLLAAGTPSRRLIAERSLARAEKELRDPKKLARAAARLEWVAARCGEAAGVEKAAELLQSLREDEARGPMLRKQQDAESRDFLRARAKAAESAGDLDAARRAWGAAAALSGGDDEKAARAAERRVEALMAKSPFLGVTFAAATPLVKGVVPGGAAEAAGVAAGDEIVSVDAAKVATPDDVREKLRGKSPGDAVSLGVRRAGKALTIRVTLSGVPSTSR